MTFLEVSLVLHQLVTCTFLLFSNTVLDKGKSSICFIDLNQAHFLKTRKAKRGTRTDGRGAEIPTLCVSMKGKKTPHPDHWRYPALPSIPVTSLLLVLSFVVQLHPLLHLDEALHVSIHGEGPLPLQGLLLNHSLGFDLHRSQP